MNFEWNYGKALLNWRRHRIDFEEAKEAFFDPNAVDDYDEAHSTEEMRYNLIGMSSRRLLFIVYTEPEANVVRIISARKAEQKHQKIYEQ
ncbi:MAG: BrnT family toxin [Caldilineaceae bacterium]